MAFCFSGVSTAVMLGASIFLGIMLFHAFNARILGGFGVALGAVCMAGYLSGVLSLNVPKAIHFVGPLAMLMFFYFAAIGAQMLRGRPIAWIDS